MKNLKRPAKFLHPRPRKRQKLTVSDSLLTTRRRNVDEAVKQLDPSADGPYCVVTRTTRQFAILDYVHVLPVATPDEIVSTASGYCVLYCLVHHVSQLDKLEWAWDLGYNTLNVDTRWNIQLRECYTVTSLIGQVRVSHHG